ncbi:MAG: hypothetical protein IKR34_04385, partial [Candidatus Gastranaerophilales bacterium]|nr:hypothetical protein [Candidatus Gastranaerophilales bacterium]
CGNYIFNTRYAKSKDSYFEKLIEKENQKPDFIAFSENVEVSHSQENNNELPDYLKNALEFLLTPEQKFILYTKYGININRCLSADDIAEELGATVRNVHKQEKFALRKLRRYLSFLNRNS